MDYILECINAYKIKYEKVSENTLRVYGNFEGFSVVREANNGCVQVDGRLYDYEDFDDWLYLITL